MKLRHCMFAALSVACFADAPPFFSEGPRPEKPNLTFDGLILVQPKYEGASGNKATVFPSITYDAPNGFFIDATSGIGFNLSSNPAFEIGPRLTLDLGRDEPDALHGMGKIPVTADAGFFADVYLSEQFGFQSSFRYGTGYHHDGTAVDVGASYAFIAHEDTRVSLDVSSSWGSRQHLQSYFGVDAGQASRTRYSQYTPSAGWYQSRIGLSANLPIDKVWSIYGTVGQAHLTNRATDSPYVVNRHPADLLFAVSYKY